MSVQGEAWYSFGMGNKNCNLVWRVGTVWDEEICPLKKDLNEVDVYVGPSSAIYP